MTSRLREVIPAQAGIQCLERTQRKSPARAGLFSFDDRNRYGALALRSFNAPTNRPIA